MANNGLLYPAGKAVGSSIRSASNLLKSPATMGFIRGYVPLAALGQVAYDYAQYRGNQMDNDPAVQSEMANMRSLISRGYVPTDEPGMYLSPEGNVVSEADIQTTSNAPSNNSLATEISLISNPLTKFTALEKLIPSTTVDIPVPDAAGIFATSAPVQEVPVADTTVKKVTATTGDSTIQGTSIPKRSRGTAKKKATTTATEVNVPSSEKILNSVNTSNSGSSGLNINFLSHINDLLPLLAAGGLGYLLAK